MIHLADGDLDPPRFERQLDVGGDGEGVGTEVTPVPPEDAGDLGRPDGLAGQLNRIEQYLAEFHRRAAHREAVIDRLHEENQRLRDGFGRQLLKPVTADLIRLYDQLAREARRLDAAGQDGLLLRSFADDVARTLDRCGIDVFSAEPGDAFERGRHRAVGVVPAADESRHNTVAEVVAAGFYDRDAGQVTRPLQARFHQYSPEARPPA